MIPIRIGDVNDNAPEFIESTIKSKKSVNELSDKDTTLISIITAIDNDGDEFNKVSYSIM